MASAFQPTPRARLRRALGLAAALATLGLGAAPAMPAPANVLVTTPEAPEQPTPAPAPPQAELRPVDPPGLDPPLLPEHAPDPAPTPVPAPGAELAPLLAPVPGLVELVPLLAPAPDAKDDAGVSSLLHVTIASSPAAPDEGSKTLAAGTPQGTGSASPQPTTGAAAPDAGASDPGPGAVSPAAPAPSGTVTVATLMPVIDAVSRPIGPARRSREIAPTGAGRRPAAPVRVAALAPVPRIAPPGSTAQAGTTGRASPAVADPPRVHHRSRVTGIPHAAARGVVRAVADAGRSPWLPIALLLATVAYLLGQRLMDGGAKLSHAGHGDEPDDELIEL